MREKLKLIIAEPKDFSAEVIKKLEQYCHVELRECEEKDIPEVLLNYDILWFRLSYKIGEELLGNKNNRCKFLVTPVTGIDHIDENACKKYGVQVICLRGEVEFLKTVRATAELTIGLTIALMRNIVQAANSVKTGIWNRDLFRGSELYNKTIGIVGYGRLGEIVAGYFLAFGAKVKVYDVKKIESKDGFIISKTLKEVADDVDILSIHVNYTQSTHHLINVEILQCLKPSAVLINTSRGGIVDENALLHCLKNNTLAGAALDVIQNEHDFRQNNPLVEYANHNNNLLLVPHIGGNTFESFRKTEDFIADKLIKLLNN